VELRRFAAKISPTVEDDREKIQRRAIVFRSRHSLLRGHARVK
jgi:hypothetical protein